MAKKRCAVYTTVHNEKYFLPLWLKYYSELFGMENLYVLDHQSTDGSTSGLQCNVATVRNDTLCDAVWLLSVLKRIQKNLLEKYEYVIRADADEFVIPDSDKYKNLSHYLDYMRENSMDTICCFGHEVIHKRFEEPPLDWRKSILAEQRKYWVHIYQYDKPVIASRPMNWTLGVHYEEGIEHKRDDALLLVHLHKVDFDVCRQTALYKNKSGRCSPTYSLYMQYINGEFERYFDNPQHYATDLKNPNCILGTVSKIPDRYRGIL